MSTSNWSGRIARTTTEAFGPYAKLSVPNETPKTPLRDRVLYLAVVAAAVAVAVMADLEMLP
jgi:hypothetical protein